MQFRGSAFNGLAIDAIDGYAGYVTDILFEDETWMLRWFVVYCDLPRSGRQVLISPSALDGFDTLGRPVSVKLSKAQVEASPTIRRDEPVSSQMEQKLDDKYYYSPTWGAAYYGGEATSPSTDGWLDHDGIITNAAAGGDPHLRSMLEVAGYHVHALDGEVGHLTDFLVDADSWRIDCVLIDTRNWWPGKHVLLQATAITEINWGGRYLRVDQTCSKIKSTDPWTEASSSVSSPEAAPAGARNA